jgi:membrane-associated protease RseP (regulator of RpoE activity)
MPDPFSPRKPITPPPDDLRSSEAEFHGESRGADGIHEDPFEPMTQSYRPDDVSRYEPIWVPIARPRVRDRNWLHALLFFITILTTTLVGIDHWLSFETDFGSSALPALSTALILKGFWYSATILTILGAHELGHYFACRYYRINASLPYFIPAPVPLTGTLGAFIRIRQPVTTKRTLFDIGIAGPLAGFIFAVPALFIGISFSHIARVPADFTGVELGEPLLFKLASWAIWGRIPDGYSLNLHPMAFAAWFGLLATALNLFPIGQLDGGHISYTVLGRRSTVVTLMMMGVAVGLAFFSFSLVVWAVLMVVMLFAFGAKHPPVMDENVPLDRGRLYLAIIALLMFALCFTPAPLRPLDLIR